MSERLKILCFTENRCELPARLDGINLATRLHQIDPTAVLMLLRTPFLLTEEVKNRYAEFGKFLVEPYEVDNDYNVILNMAAEKRILQLSQDLKEGGPDDFS